MNLDISQHVIAFQFLLERVQDYRLTEDETRIFLTHVAHWTLDSDINTLSMWAYNNPLMSAQEKVVICTSLNLLLDNRESLADEISKQSRGELRRALNDFTIYVTGED